MPRTNGPLSIVFIDFFADFIQRADVQSVSCPFTDEKLWRLLVAEQKRRAKQSGLHNQHAFALSGPNGGLPFDPADWGGYVHTPYEGAAESDLFMKPLWRAFDLAAGNGEGGSLTSVNYDKPCHHLLLPGDRGELDCATRIQLDGWTLYSSKLPYESLNPFLGCAYRAGERSPPPVPVYD